MWLLVGQALVLGLTVLLWWVARRDLAAQSAESRAPATEHWDQLRMTVEQLMAELERRAIVAEQRIREAEHHLQIIEQRFAGVLHSAPASVSVPEMTEASAAAFVPAEPSAPLPAKAMALSEPLAPQDARYASVEALITEGVLDVSEISHRTGIARGEVELIMSLRGRRMT